MPSIARANETAPTDAPSAQARGAPLAVLAETAYPLIVPSARVRIARFAPFLAEHGVDVMYSPTLSDRQYEIVASPASAVRKAGILAGAAGSVALRRRPPHDLLLVHRLRLLGPFPGLDPPRWLDVYDFDDALPVGSAAPANRRFQWAKQEARRSLACVRRSKLVIAGNSRLADLVREQARRVEVVPSCVDPLRQSVRSHRAVDVATVGWIGSQTTSPYLEPLLPVLERLNATRVRARLVLVGAHPAIRAPWVEHRAWSPETEADDLASFDVGIMPLPNTAWARGKCGYKVLQYFAAGVPAVASPVGVAAELVGADRGLLADTPMQWRRALELLIADVGERRERGAAARQFVERQYSYQRWAPELASLLRSVIG